MEFRFTEEQQMIRDTAEAFLAEVSTAAAVRAAMATERGYDEALWRQISEEMMWPALHIPEAYGGLGLGFVELAAMQEQMGRVLLCAPFLATVGMGVNALLVAPRPWPSWRRAAARMPTPCRLPGQRTVTVSYSTASTAMCSTATRLRS